MVAFASSLVAGVLPRTGSERERMLTRAANVEAAYVVSVIKTKRDYFSWENVNGEMAPSDGMKKSIDRLYDVLTWAS